MSNSVVAIVSIPPAVVHQQVRKSLRKSSVASHRMPAKVLRLLPDSWPLADVSGYLTYVFRQSVHEAREARLCKRWLSFCKSNRVFCLGRPESTSCTFRRCALLIRHALLSMSHHLSCLSANERRLAVREILLRFLCYLAGGDTREAQLHDVPDDVRRAS